MTDSLITETITEVKDTAHLMLRGDLYGDNMDTTRAIWGDPLVTEHGPMIAVMLTLEFPGGREVDHLIVGGIANPHDGQLTVWINHIDGFASHDNADAMFPA